MTNSKLQQGISILYDMEINNYYITRAIRSLDNEISRLGNRKTFRLPSRRKNQGTILGGAFVFAMWGAGIVAAIVTIVAIIEAFITSDGFFGLIFNLILSIIAGPLYGCVVGGIGGIVVGGIYGAIDKRLDKERIEDEYHKALAEHHIDKIADDIRVESELRERQTLQRQRLILQQRLGESQKALAKFYNKIGIDENFRHIIPIGYMYEFSRLEIATQLEGNKGLYDRVREELKMDYICHKLEEISDKLDVIIDNQRELHGELVAMNQKCDRMVQMTLETVRNSESIVCNTAVTAYNTERIQKELEYQNFMMLYSAS